MTRRMSSVEMRVVSFLPVAVATLDVGGEESFGGVDALCRERRVEDVILYGGELDDSRVQGAG